MGPEVSFTLLIPQRCFPQYGKKSFALDLVVFGLPVSLSSERGLSPPERSERNRRDSWFPAAFFHLHLLQWAQIHHTFPRSDVLQSRSNTMQQNHTQAEQEKPLSSTCNGDLCLHKLKALLLQFLLYKNGAMGMATGMKHKSHLFSRRDFGRPFMEGFFLLTDLLMPSSPQVQGPCLPIEHPSYHRNCRFFQTKKV